MSEREQKRDPDFILRSNSVSVLLTLLALGATVAGIYGFFPRRDNELMTQAIEAHRRRTTPDFAAPTDRELEAWTLGAVGEPVPWPERTAQIRPLGAIGLEIQKGRAAMVRYEVAGNQVSIVARRARDPARRTARRLADDLAARSWRRGRWTFVAVGPAAAADQWIALIGAPK
jgi:hypothetical protein